MQQNLQQLYTSALNARSVWLNRWNDARRYTIPSSDEDMATLFDSTASDQVFYLPG